ncbi:hypothetical protein ACGF5O_34100 [Streptomyces sp. NPDC048291]|uniref:hypothetical protein n=1 Tax=Streptomyces sp. NPDC048291 TaxID=3365530 RepID=UPI003720D832
MPVSVSLPGSRAGRAESLRVARRPFRGRSAAAGRGENVVVEFPFAPEGSPARLAGRTAVHEYLKGCPDLIDVHRIASLTVHATDGPDTAVADLERHR